VWPQFTRAERERERGLEFARQIGGIRSHYLLYHLLYLSPSWEKNVRLDCWHMFVVVSFFFLFLNPWTYIRSLLPRQLVSSDCVLLQGRVRKKEIDRLHYRLLCQNEPRSLVFEQTKHLGQVYKSVVAIYDHSTRIFSFPPFFLSLLLLNFQPCVSAQVPPPTSKWSMNVCSSCRNTLPTKNVGSLVSRPARRPTSGKIIHRDELFNCERS
jgi:hypothetical protein